MLAFANFLKNTGLFNFAFEALDSALDGLAITPRSRNVN